MKKLYIKADFGDADYGHYLAIITDETFERFLPVFKAINDFEPYIIRHRYGGVDYSNWESRREDLGEMSLEEKYPDIIKGLKLLHLPKMQKKRNFYATKAELLRFVFNLYIRHAPDSLTNAHSDWETNFLPVLFKVKRKKFRIFCIVPVVMHGLHPMKDKEKFVESFFFF